MIMRWIFASFIIIAGIYLVRVQSTRNLAIRRLTFVAFVLIGISSLVFKDAWAKISDFLGVESGTSLLTYFVTFAFIFSVISSYQWRKNLETKVAELTRIIAINEYKHPQKSELKEPN